MGTTKCQNCGKTVWEVKICQKCGFSACKHCNFSNSCKKCHFGKMNEMKIK